MAWLPGKFTWFDHVSSDVAKARAFYEELFGWKVQTFALAGGTYDMIHNAGQGIGGMQQAPAGRPDHWAAYLSVDDVDARFAAAVAAGAKPLVPPQDVHGVGRGALLSDPTGALVSLWRSSGGDRDDVARTPAGDWCWIELTTPDVKAALAFYEGVFGFTHEDVDMGEMGMYHLLKGPDGVTRGGVMQAPEPGMPANWMPYVEVEDTDKTAARAAPLGGKLLLEPHDIPHVGRVAIVEDPLGVPIGFIRSEVPA